MIGKVKIDTMLFDTKRLGHESKWVNVTFRLRRWENEERLMLHMIRGYLQVKSNLRLH